MSFFQCGFFIRIVFCCKIHFVFSFLSVALADALGSNVCLSRDKYNTMCCLESEPIRKLLTTDWKAAQVHVLPMMQLNVKVCAPCLPGF